MIYTFTLNPSIDYFLKIKGDPVINEVNRGTDTVFKAGGKGLNVSKILSVLGIPSKAVVLLGGFTGAFIRSECEKDENIELISVEVKGDQSHQYESSFWKQGSVHQRRRAGSRR